MFSYFKIKEICGVKLEIWLNCKVGGGVAMCEDPWPEVSGYMLQMSEFLYELCSAEWLIVDTLSGICPSICLTVTIFGSQTSVEVTLCNQCYRRQLIFLKHSRNVVWLQTYSLKFLTFLHHILIARKLLFARTLFLHKFQRSLRPENKVLPYNHSTY